MDDYLTPSDAGETLPSMSALPERLAEFEELNPALGEMHDRMWRTIHETISGLEAGDPYYEGWGVFLDRLLKTLAAGDLVDPLIEEGYRTVLMSRSAPLDQQVVVWSRADWDALPQRSFEDGFRRYGLIE